MDLKNKVLFEVVKGSEKKNSYMFLMDYGCPLGEAYDACHEVLEKIVQLSQQAADRVKQSAQEKEKKEH